MPLDRGARGTDPDLKREQRKAQAEARKYIRQRKRAAKQAVPVRGEAAADKVPPRTAPLVRPTPDAAEAVSTRPQQRFEQRRNQEIARQYGVGRLAQNVQAPGLIGGFTDPLVRGAMWSFTHPRERLMGRTPEEFQSYTTINGRRVPIAVTDLPYGFTRGFFRGRRAATPERPPPEPEIEFALPGTAGLKAASPGAVGREPVITRNDPAPPLFGGEPPEPPPRPPTAAAPDEPPPPQWDEGTLEEALGSPEFHQQAILAQQQQEALNTVGRRRQISAADAAFERAGGGMAGHRAARAAMQGELEKVQFRAFANRNITGEELDRIGNYIKSRPDFAGFRAYNAIDAVRKVVNGLPPTKSERAMLARLFGQEQAAKIAEDANIWRRSVKFVNDSLGLPRAAQSSADVSAGLRQSLNVLFSHPRMWKGAWAQSLRGWKQLTPKQRQALIDQTNQELIDHPNFERAEEGGLALNGFGGFREEAYPSHIADSIPILSQSSAQYTLFLNRLRMDFFDYLLARGRKLGHDIDDREFLRETAKIVNEMTGRGSLGTLEPAVGALSKLFFSPRLMASRVKMYGRAMHPYTWTGGRGPGANPAKRIARREARRAIPGLVLGGTAVLALASRIPGVEVGLDPRSADFGRIKVGDTRFDIWGGYEPYAVAAARAVTGEKVNSASGDVEEMERWGTGQVFGTLESFLENKYAPIPKFFVEWDTAGEASGREFDPVREAGKALLPIGLSSAGETYFEYGPQRAAAEFGASFVGLGAQTYPAQPSKQKTPEQKFNALIREQTKLARGMGIPGGLPQEVREAYTLRERVNLAVDRLYEQQKKAGNVTVPKGEKFKLHPRQVAAATMEEIIRAFPQEREMAAAMRSDLDAATTRRDINRFLNAIRSEFYSGVIEKWRREAGEYEDELERQMKETAGAAS